MKKKRVSKLVLLLLAAAYTCPAISQDSIDYTLNNIKNYASHMDASFSAMSSSRTGNERKARLQAAEKLKAFSDSISTEMEYLPDDYYFRLSPLVSAYRADIDEYAKLMINDDFEGRETCLSAAFSSLQQRMESFRQAISLAYKHAVSQNTAWEDLPAKAQENDTQVWAEQPSGTNTTLQDNSNTTVLSENAGNNGSSRNTILLDTIHQCLQQIENAIQLAERAVSKNDAGAIRLHTTRIADASLTISGLSLLLVFKGKENLYMLASSLRHAAENLRALGKKGASARSDMADSLREIKIKSGSLSTGIGFVK